MMLLRRHETQIMAYLVIFKHVMFLDNMIMLAIYGHRSM